MFGHVANFVYESFNLREFAIYLKQLNLDHAHVPTAKNPILRFLIAVVKPDPVDRTAKSLLNILKIYMTYKVIFCIQPVLGEIRICVLF